MTLADVRTAIATTIEANTSAAVYKSLRRAPDLPAAIIGWPASLDYRATSDGGRDYVIPVELYVQVVDEDGADEALEALVDEVVDAVAASAWDIQPSTDWGETTLADQRVVLACRVPVVVFE